MDGGCGKDLLPIGKEECAGMVSWPSLWRKACQLQGCTHTPPRHSGPGTWWRCISGLECAQELQERQQGTTERPKGLLWLCLDIEGQGASMYIAYVYILSL